MTERMTVSQRVADSNGVSCNDQQELFVIPSGGGYSTFGYKNCHRQGQALAEALGRPDLTPSEDLYGTLASYELYQELLHLASKVDIGTWFAPDTDPKVRQVINRLMGSSARVRITYGDTETGRAWDDRPDTGRVGRTTGILKSPILVATERSHGGGIISTDSIVRIDQGDVVLYSHPKFHRAPPTPPEPAALPAPAIDPLAGLQEREEVAVPRL